jgi:membrane-associated phospholipid phosphatase
MADANDGTRVNLLDRNLAGPLMRAAAWPGQSPRGQLMPAVVAIAVALIAGPRAGLWQALAWGVTPLGEAVKRLVHRPRPLVGRLNALRGLDHGASIPSTHVSNYVATLGFAAWVLARTGSAAAVPFGALGLMLVGLIGPSRVRTGDHRWSDVLGGYAFGAAYLALLIGVARRDRSLGARSGGGERPGDRGDGGDDEIEPDYAVFADRSQRARDSTATLG